MELHQCILTENDCMKRNRVIEPKGIMIHSTGANNPYLFRYVQPDDGLLGKNIYGNHWNRPDLPVCVHGFIGKLWDGTPAVYQTLPWTHRGWHCGGPGNDSYISFEVCEDDLSDEGYFRATYALAAELCAHLCKEYGLNPLGEAVIIDHAEGHRLGLASGHMDISHWWNKFGKTVADFRRDVAKLLEAPQLTEAHVQAMIDESLDGKLYNTVADVPAWARPTVQRLVDRGLLLGDGQGLKLSYALLRMLVLWERIQEE